MKKKILFIISDTGGGHRSAANAVTASLTAAGADVNCEMVDLLRASGLPGIRNAPELYAFFSSGHIWLHNFLFRLANRPWFMDIASNLLYRFARNRISKIIAGFGPDLVVVIHPLAVRPMCTYRDETQATWPVVTIVTDLISVHASWICPRADFYLMPTQKSVEIAKQFGVPSSKIRCTGFPVHPRFCSAHPDQTAARLSLGIDSTRYTVLLTSGGAGGGKIESLVNELERKCPQCTLLIITGRNHRLHKKLANRTSPSLHTHVYGFVENMELLMAACDIVITKAGPGTIMEASCLQRRLIITGAVGLQEEGNILFVLDSGIGVHCPTPAAVSQQITESMNSGNLLSGSSHFPSAGTSSITNALLAIMKTNP